MSTNQEGGDGAEAEGLVAAEVGVGEESAEESGEVGGAAEDAKKRGCGNARHVENGG